MNTHPEQVKKRLGQVIRDKRKALGYSQDSFSLECGLHRTYIGAVERGERNVALENILNIANALGISPSDLFKAAGI